MRKLFLRVILIPVGLLMFAALPLHAQQPAGGGGGGGGSGAGASPPATGGVHPFDLGRPPPATRPEAPRAPEAAVPEAAAPEAPGFVAPLVHLCDAAGRLATLNLNTRALRVIGRMGVVLTDIGFAPNGTLYGVTFTQLYRVNPATATVTKVGTGLGVAGINALTFSRPTFAPARGKAFAAVSNRRGFFFIDPVTGRASFAGDNGPFTSAGDFAFDGNHLYFAANGRLLVDYDFTTSTYTARATGIDNLFGLVVPSPGVLVGFADTVAYRLNPATGAGTVLINFTGRGLSRINGAASQRLF
jgi:hypothetical protein